MSQLDPDRLRRFVSVGGVTKVVVLGDTVWWFAGNDVNATPHIATVVSFCEDSQVDLEVRTHTDQPRVTKKTGICLVGDPRLANINLSKRGSWMPRWEQKELLPTG